jgi:hypothetical protein
MVYNICVKETFTHKYGHGGSVTVPAGSRTTSASAHGGDFRWLDPSIFHKDSIEYHDAYYYGIRVPTDNQTEGDRA